MIQILNQHQIHPNTLLQTENLMKDWAEKINIQTINLIIDDLKKHNFDIVKVDGYTPLWDATVY